ncbi:MAG: type VI secretion system-associated protein TagF [Gammaproteobacteria bacterium]|nr:type VI secretion system-associated protein TagF [Gammaproteobacteria bacterium]
MTDTTNPCGLFGKVPQQADYVSHHLPESFTEYWHHWLQSAMSVSREQLGERWLDFYLTSPIWHFAISPGVFGHQAAVGVLIPSIDEVGRYLPLTVAHVHATHQPWPAYLKGGDWYRAAQDVALSALNEQTSYTQLIGALESLQAPPFPPVPYYETQHANHGLGKGYCVSAPADQAREQLTASLLDVTYTRLLNSYSVWWTDGSAHVEPCLLISANLPEAGQFAAMLDGQWQRWHWSIEQRVTREANGR